MRSVGLLDFLNRSPHNKKCIQCGQRAAHGYSEAAESDCRQIKPLCLPCLIGQLRSDYADFHGRAIVVAPAPGLPCYVFRDRDFLRSVSSNSERDADILFGRIGECVDCHNAGTCAWLESRGLTIKTFSDVLDKGHRHTLLAWGNPDPLSLCGRCTADRIGKILQSNAFEFFEICSPHQGQQGIVMPMAY